jgi:hypothetical protein
VVPLAVGTMFLACTSACGTTYELAALLSSSEIHVDPSQPTELAQPSVVLEIGTFEKARTIVVANTSARSSNGDAFDLDLALEGGEVMVPSHTRQELALVNRTQTNADLASQCQTLLSFQFDIQVPDQPDIEMTMIEDLAVFCP